MKGFEFVFFSEGGGACRLREYPLACGSVAVVILWGFVKGAFFGLMGCLGFGV